jgi:hypothetical protein
MAVPQLGDAGSIVHRGTVLDGNSTYAVFLILKHGLAGAMALPEALFTPHQLPRPVKRAVVQDPSTE